jgi:hypothetical protein
VEGEARIGNRASMSMTLPAKPCQPFKRLYRFNTHRMASDLVIHRICYAAW